jgi:hypothetical protein
MSTFWRVLDDAPLFDTESLTVAPNPQSTKRRWSRGEYNSTHMSCPPEWQEKWQQGHTSASQYSSADLNCATGLHTQSALDRFLVNAADFGLVAPWPDDVLIAVGELDGTCAWETKEQAWHYVLGKTPEQSIEDCAISDEKLDLSFIVEFAGDDVGVAIPEGHDEGGGRQVRVTHPGVIKPARQFAEENGFTIPLEINDISLDVPGEGWEPEGG